jgi:hypothetical protein
MLTPTDAEACRLNPDNSGGELLAIAIDSRV